MSIVPRLRRDADAGPARSPAARVDLDERTVALRRVEGDD
jgi:hypothetical protein